MSGVAALAVFGGRSGREGDGATSQRAGRRSPGRSGMPARLSAPCLTRRRPCGPTGHSSRSSRDREASTDFSRSSAAPSRRSRASTSWSRSRRARSAARRQASSSLAQVKYSSARRTWSRFSFSWRISRSSRTSRSSSWSRSTRSVWAASSASRPADAPPQFLVTPPLAAQPFVQLVQLVGQVGPDLQGGQEFAARLALPAAAGGGLVLEILLGGLELGEAQLGDDTGLLRFPLHGERGGQVQR